MSACTTSIAVCLPSVNCDAWFAPPAKCSSCAAPLVATRLGAVVIGWVAYDNGFFERHLGCIRA